MQGLRGHIGDLPAILLVAIIEHLDAETLLRAAPVCKLWASVYKGALHQLDVSSARSPARAQRAAAWLQKNGQDLQELRYAPRFPAISTESVITISSVVYSALLNVTQLRSLELAFGRNGVRLQTQGLAALQSLTSLSLSSCYLENEDIAPLLHLSALRRLNLSDCQGFNAFAEPEAFSKSLAQLTTLNLSGCAEVTNISGFSDLQQLQQLDLSSVPNIGFSSLPLMPSLTKLTFKHNDAYLAPAGDKALSNLLELDLNGCHFNTDGRGLSTLVALTRLEAVPGLRRADRSFQLTAIGPLQQLRHLNICTDFKQADPVSSFSVLATLQHLTHLELTGPTLPARALAAVFRADQAGAAVACFPKLQCLSISTENDMWQLHNSQAPGACISSDELGRLV